jgi:hypothetical protein
MLALSRSTLGAQFSELLPDRQPHLVEGAPFKHLRGIAELSGLEPALELVRRKTVQETEFWPMSVRSRSSQFTFLCSTYSILHQVEVCCQLQPGLLHRLQSSAFQRLSRVPAAAVNLVLS